MNPVNTKIETQKLNHPAKGSQIKVEPIKDLKAIRTIKKILQDKKMDLALFTIGINTNLRASDLREIKVKQVRLLVAGESFTIKEKKTKKNRNIFLNNSCIDAIKSLLGSKKYDDNDFLFTGQRGAWSVSYINLKVKSWCKEINIKGNFGSHTLRKTFGYHQRVTFKEDLPVLMKCFNHSSQKQTLDYLCIDEKEIKNVFMNEL